MGKKNRIRAAKAVSHDSAQKYLQTPKAKKALDEELRIFLTDQFKFVVENNLAVILWVLHEVFGFGKIRIMRFVQNYDRLVEELLQKYEMFDSAKDIDFLCRRELLKMGIDVSTMISKKDIL